MSVGFGPLDPQQSDLIRGRPLRLQLGAGPELDHNAAPVDGVTEPDWMMSPVAPTGLRTTGFAFGFKAPTVGAVAAVAPAAGFAVTVWVRNPVTRAWFSFATVQIGYSELWGTFDVDAAQIFFQVAGQTSNGSVDLHPMEQ